jgi:predicted RNase H-like nuclease (RuvC/YqgF family)
MNETCEKSNSKYVPPKEWEELNDSEKIERMREVIKNLQSSLSRVERSNNSLRIKLSQHGHNDKGEPVEIKKIERYDDSLGDCGVVCGSSLSTKNYF